MKVPDKIYICPSELAGIDYEEEWLDRPFGDSIEYIRTDDFIEKACEWFEENFMNVHKWEISTYEFENTKSMIDEFRKYMKGVMI